LIKKNTKSSFEYLLSTASSVYLKFEENLPQKFF